MNTVLLVINKEELHSFCKMSSTTSSFTTYYVQNFFCHVQQKQKQNISPMDNNANENPAADIPFV